jgi:hypothetical protein
MNVGHYWQAQDQFGRGRSRDMSRKHRRTGRLLAVTIGVTVASLMFSSFASAATNFPLWRNGESPIAYGQPVPVGATSIQGLNLHFRDNNSYEMWVECSGLTSKGSVENPGAAKPGTYKSSGASFHSCELVELGDQSVSSNPPLTCAIAKEMPAEVYNAVLTNEAAATGVFKLSISFTFVVTCPQTGVSFSEPVTITGKGRELWPGQHAFWPQDTTVVGQHGNGEAEFGFGVSSTKVPVTIGEKAYEEPKSTGGDLWYKGGAERTVTEGPPIPLKAGTPTPVVGTSASFTIESVQSGVAEKIRCSSGTVSGSAENPIGGGPGVGSIGLGLSSCAVLKPEGRSCSVVGSAINLKTTAGAVGPEPAFPTFFLGNVTTELGSVTVANCTLLALNRTLAITGKLLFKPQMRAAATPGSWALPSALNRAEGYLLMGGQKAFAEGELSVGNGEEVLTLG